MTTLYQNQLDFARKNLPSKTAKAHHYRQAFAIWLATFLKLAQADEKRIGANLALDGSDFTEPTASERLACAAEHLRMMIAAKGERTAVAEARKHMAWYTRGMYGSAVFRSKLNSAVTAAEMTDILLQIEKDVTI